MRLLLLLLVTIGGNACDTERPPPSTEPAALTQFPTNQALVVLRTDDATVLTNPEADPVLASLYRSYGHPQVTKAFPQFLDYSQVRRQLLRTVLVPFRVAQKRLAAGQGGMPFLPQLQRFYVLTFAPGQPLPAILARLRQSTAVSDAFDNFLVKLQATVGQPYYESTMAWFAPYGKLLGLSAAEVAVLPLVGASVGHAVYDALDDVLPPLMPTYAIDPAKASTHWQFRGAAPMLTTICQRQVAAGVSVCMPGEVRIKFDDSMAERDELALLTQWGFQRITFNPDSDAHRCRVPTGWTVATAMTFLASPSRRAQVLYAEPSFQLKAAQIAPADEYYPGQWAWNGNLGVTNPPTNNPYITSLFAELVWDQYQGLGPVAVAVIDSGIMLGHDDFFQALYAHDNTNLIEDFILEESWLLHSSVQFNQAEFDAFALGTVPSSADPYPYDFAGWDFILYPSPATALAASIASGDGTAPLDHCREIGAHGTAVSSIIAAQSSNGTYGIAGASMTNSIKVIPIAAATAVGGACLMQQGAAALTYAHDAGATIANFSYGGVADTELATLITTYSDLLVVASAGNENSDLDAPFVDVFPCEYSDPNLLCVGALNNFGQRALFAVGGSNFGANVDVTLPGTSISAATWNTTTQAESFDSLSGTSFSAALASGVLAFARGVCTVPTPADLVTEFTGDGANFEQLAAYAANRCATADPAGGTGTTADGEPPECDECTCQDTCPYQGCLFTAAEMACEKGGTPPGCSAGEGTTLSPLVLAALGLVCRRRRRRARTTG